LNETEAARPRTSQSLAHSLEKFLFMPARVLTCLLFALALSGCGRGAPGSAPVPSGGGAAPIASTEVKLSLGDPVVQKALQLSGQLDKLSFKVDWQNISGGPQTLEAFRAGVLDGGSVGDTPPIHATFTGLDVKIVAVLVRDAQVFQLALAPGVKASSVAELRGKRIAYSPGQAQGAVVLRALKKAALSTKDVTLVELSSSEFKDALASRQVDAAPLSGTILLRYLNENRAQGAGSLAPGVRDNLGFFYVRAAVLRNPQQAAALREYVKFRIRAQLWTYAHPREWIDGYYVKDQGLTKAEGQYIVDTSGRPSFPDDWSDVIAWTQETIDLLATTTGKPRFEAGKIFDLSFQSMAAGAVSDGPVVPTPEAVR
jgi:sulfonate transport system substrate-binding protein